ncbi:unnamed protein product [Parnassius apollo]|uniref:(apollo) hypothetical protein n=1 Tax=Parnassius apollo TaxID=110799 RepID=A0A8S3WMP7_PARAO|nr:unnamed protein product [Parnassius apollo]
MADVIVETVFSRDDEKFSKDKKWKLFLKQLLVISAVWTSYFMYGLCLGSPTVFIPQIRKSNSNDTISDEMASWLWKNQQETQRDF